jgi:DNA-binding CsgD family transcriptional regulator
MRVAEAREAFAAQAWARARELLAAADVVEPLAAPDLERLAAAAALVGRSQESADAWTRAHRAHADAGDAPAAAHCAFWLAFGLLNDGDLAQGSGWLDRAQRLLDDAGLDCVELGYLVYLSALRAVFEGDVEAARRGFAEAVAAGQRFRSAELLTLARVGLGRCLIYLDAVEDGIRLLDESMVSVAAREVSPIAVGDVYCTVIDACQELFDLRRMHEWTAALSRWCDAQPDLALYRGQCLVHRAEILQLHGSWGAALVEAERACDRLAGQRALGAAYYQRAEVHRVRGEFEDAETAYRRASELGREPQPGLALLRLSRGQTQAAGAAIRRVLDEATDPLARARVLGAYGEIVLAEGDVAAARAAAAELTEIAAGFGAPFLRAVAAHGTGAVRLADGDARGALVALRDACQTWRNLDAPYEVARVRVLIGEACRAGGDLEGAELERQAAESVFRDLHALPELARIARASTALAGGLTSREAEVIALVASGRTNRAIADTLVISEKTVARHISNIFAKLGVSSRAAATAFAYEHHLV